MKYNSTLIGGDFYAIEVPLSDDLDFHVELHDSTIQVSIGTKATNYWRHKKEHHSIIDKIVFQYEAARPSFEPEKIITNLLKMYEALRLSFNKFYKHAKIINKSCGNIPIHGKH